MHCPMMQFDRKSQWLVECSSKWHIHRTKAAFIDKQWLLSSTSAMLQAYAISEQLLEQPQMHFAAVKWDFRNKFMKVIANYYMELLQ